MATIKEIAKMCSVSIATVSNVLNGKPGASIETQKMIYDAVEKLNYTPNDYAKRLKQKTGRTIGIITEDLTAFTTPALVDSIHCKCEMEDFEFILGNMRLYKKYSTTFHHNDSYHKEMQNEFRLMLSKQVDGIIYIGSHSREISFIPQVDVPVVLVYCYQQHSDLPSIIFNDEKGAFDATSELVRAGHEKIGLITGPLDSMHTHQRILGYQRALFENGLLFNPKFVVYGDWNAKDGYDAMNQLPIREITAVFAMNDPIAGGVYRYAEENGLRIGKDLSLIGFDNQAICEAYRPGLTTMDLPLFEMGQTAAEIMLDMIRGQYKDATDEFVQIDCRLVRRASVLTLK